MCVCVALNYKDYTLLSFTNCSTSGRIQNDPVSLSDLIWKVNIRKLQVLKSGFIE